jgi:NADH-quinone oxidoreductase subunit N
MNNIQSLSYFIPEFILIGTILMMVVVDLFIRKRESHQVGLWLLGGLFLTLLSFQLVPELDATPLFMNTLAFDPFARFFKILVLFATGFIILMSVESEELSSVRTGEYYMLLGIMVFGMFLMASAIDLIMVYLAIEIVSIVSFVLAGYLKKNKRSNESALKYVIYGAFSSGLMLFGLSILFGVTGSTKFFEIRSVLGSADPDSFLAVVIASILILAGFGYKISAVPFHFWTPDVYEGAPTPVTAFLSVAPKAAGFAILIRFFNDSLSDGGVLNNLEFGYTGLPWGQLLAVLSFLTMTLGNVVAIQQVSVKRMLAYSSIAHAGYMLMAAPLLSQDGIYAILMYLVMYLFMNLGAFMVVIAIKNKCNGGESFDDFKGLGWEMPLLGGVMTLFMISLTGLPPTAGFIGKFYIFYSVIQAGNAFYWLVFAGAINSVISLYYYMRVVKVMYLDGKRTESLSYPSTLTTILLLGTGIPSLLFGVYWSPIADWVSDSLRFLFQTI